MVLLTFIYVIATIVICAFNYLTIVEQRNINQKQMRISSFLLRYEVYKQIIDELHLWRFVSNNQVTEFSSMRDRNDVFLYLATHNQNYFDLSTKARLVFNEEIAKQVDIAWNIIRDEVYPPINDLVTKSQMNATPTSILVQIKYAMQEDTLKGVKDRLTALEASLSLLVETEIQISKNI